MESVCMCGSCLTSRDMIHKVIKLHLLAAGKLTSLVGNNEWQNDYQS